MNFKAIIWDFKPKDDGSCAIKIRISDGPLKKYHNLKHYVAAKDWNDKKGRVLDRRLNCDSINSDIVSSIGKLEAIYLNNRNLSIDEVINLFKGKKTEENLLDFILSFINKCKSGEIKRSHGTYKAYKVTYNNLIKYRDTGVTINFDNINQDFYLKYTYYLRYTLSMSESSVGKEVKHLKVFLNQAIELGISNNIEHRKKGFKITTEDTDKIYLNKDEIDRIVNLDLQNLPHLEVEQHRFIVSYYLLLRFSDSMNIDKGKIISNEKGCFIRTKTIKTGGNIIVPIKPIIWDILNKYNFKMPKHSNQECNKKLKELGQLAKIEGERTTCSTVAGKRVEVTSEKYNLITTHTARRSGATNLYKDGVPPKMIMDLGGWKTESSFMRYIRIGREENAELAIQYDFFK